MLSRHGLLMLLLVALATGRTAFASIESAVVTGGAIEGMVVEGVGVFKGIPFAAPPVGDLRWQVPRPVVPWQGIRSAREFAPACMQSWIPQGQTPPSEDCLYLNVWTAAATSSERRPVIVWVHGGGLVGGMSWEKISDGTNLAREGAVVVTIAYRLGAFGFVAHPELTRENGKTSGNYGLHDMVAALRWVQQNIAQFGGDASRVLLIGGSAGASSISVLAASPQAKGLYSRAAALGGAIFAPGAPTDSRYQYYFPTLADYERKGEALFKELGVSNLQAARALPASTVLKATDGWPSKYGINRDGDLVLGYNQELFQQRRFNDTPILIGYTSDEVGVPPGTTLASAQANLRTLPCRHTLDAIVAAYPRLVSDEQTRAVLSQVYRDQNIGWATWTWARLQAENGRGAVYGYFFDIHGPERPNGAPHAAEYSYIFGNFWNTPAQRDLLASAIIRQYVLNFAARGDPNAPGLPQWDRFEETNQRVMVFDRVFHSSEWPNLAALQAITPFLKCYASTQIINDAE
jgi:para-nitrobenzyl esterase